MANDATLMGEQLLLGGSQEAQQLSRQRRIAELLMAKGVQQPQGEMVSGRYVGPSALESLAPMFNAAMGIGLDENLDKKQLEISEALRKAKSDALNQFRRLASNPETQAEAFEFANSNKFLQDLAKEINKPRTEKEGEKFVIPGANGKPIVLSDGGESLSPATKAIVERLGLPKDRKLWTEAQNAAVRNYIDPAEKIKIGQTNQRMAYEGIGGVGIPGGGGGGGGGNPMSNALRGQMPMQPGNAGPAGNVGQPVQTTAQAPMEYAYNPRLSPKRNDEEAAKFYEDLNKNVKNAKGAFQAIKQAAPILQAGDASSGYFNGLVTKAANAMNIPTKASEADQQLRVLGGALTGMQPRFEGPQGVLDVEIYKQMAGDVANTEIPIASRMAALRTMVELQRKYDPTNDWDGILKTLTPVDSKESKPAGRVSVGAPSSNQGFRRIN